MAGRWVYFCSVLIGILICNTQSSEENCNTEAADIVITDNEALKRIEVRKSANFTSTLLPSPAVIQQGNNLFIKPKFILGSPFTSYKHGNSPAHDGSIPNVPVAEIGTMIGLEAELPHFPTQLIPPAPQMVIPMGVPGDISLPLTEIENQLPTPIALPIIDSIFTSHKHVYNPTHDGFMISEIPQLPTIFVPPTPPMEIPVGVPADISLPLTEIGYQPPIPIAVPNIGSSFTSYKHSYNSAHDGFMLSKVPVQEIGTVIGKPEIPQLPTIFVPPAPPMDIPVGVPGDISLPLTKIENQPPISIAVPNICQSIPCPPGVIPMYPYLPQLPNYPILLEEPETPIVGPERPMVVPETPIVVPGPPELPPTILPELPIQVMAQRPIIPIPDQRIFISSFYPPTVRCNQDNSPSVASIFNDMYQKFKNLLNNSNSTESTTVSGTEEQTSKPDLPVEYPTLCVQAIVAERVIPNIVTNDEVEVYMNPISPYQLAPLNYYRK